MRIDTPRSGYPTKVLLGFVTTNRVICGVMDTVSVFAGHRLGFGASHCAGLGISMNIFMRTEAALSKKSYCWSRRWKESWHWTYRTSKFRQSEP